MDGSRQSRENTGEIHKVDFRLGLQYTSVSNFGGNKNLRSKDRSEKRAIKYEEKTKQLNKNKIVQECWRKIHAKQEETRSKGEEMRDSYYRQKIMEIQEMEIERRKGREFAEELGQRDWAEQVQWQYDRIRGDRHNVHHAEIRDNQIANYLNGDQNMFGRFKCGSEERRSK